MTHIAKEFLNLKPLDRIYSALREDLVTRGQAPKYPTGLQALDEIVWGLHKKEVMVVGARSSMGKSAFAINTVRHLADKGITFVFFSLEMTNEQVVERLLANISEISLLDLRQGKALDQIISKENLFTKWAQNVRLLVNDVYGYNFDSIVEVCKKIKPDFVVIDYIQMISAKGFPSKREAIEEFLIQIKTLAMDMNFGIMLLSQINREGVEKPAMDQLKHSGVLEEMADTVLLLQWLWEERRYYIYIAKQRHGECGKIEVKFEPQFSRFDDLKIKDINNEKPRAYPDNY